MSEGRKIIDLVAERQDRDQFRRKNWVGTFEEYLDIVRENPMVTRTAYQRLYDMILSYGVEVVRVGPREENSHYRFFDDPHNGGKDAVFGLRSLARITSSTPSKVRPMVTASNAGCCYCTARWEAARAPLPDC